VFTQSTKESLQLAQQWIEVIGPFFVELLFKATLWAVFFALISLLIAVIIMRKIHRRTLLRRGPRWWNTTAKLSYLVIMITLPLIGATGGSLYGIQRLLENGITETVEPALASQMPALRALLVEEFGPMASDTMITARDLVQPIVQEFLYHPQNQSTTEILKAKAINVYLLKHAARALTHAFQQSMKLLPEILPSSGFAAQDELIQFSVGSVIKVLAGAGEHIDFTNLDHNIPSIFSDAMRKQITAFFMGLYIGLGIKLLLVAILIGVEMLFYFKYYLPKKNRPALEAA